MVEVYPDMAGNDDVLKLQISKFLYQINYVDGDDVNGL